MAGIAKIYRMYYYYPTCKELEFAKIMVNKGKGEMYRQACKVRSVWIDEDGTQINKYKIFDYLRDELGEDPYENAKCAA